MYTWVVDLYRHNRLMKGEMVIRGERVELKNLKSRHLASPPLYRSGGHIGIMAGSAAHKLTWSHIDGWLARRSD